MTDTIQTLNSADFIRGTDTRSKQYMPAVDAFAFFLNELDDMIAVFGLDDTTHTFGVIEVKSHLSELAYELPLAYKTQLTTSFGTLRVFRIESREHTEIGTSVLHTLREITQFLLHPLGLFSRNRWFKTQNLHLYLRRHHRYRIHRERVIVPPDIRRGRFDV